MGQTQGPNVGGLQRGGGVNGPVMGQQTVPSKVPESQTVQIRDLKSAKRVASLLAGEMQDEAKLSKGNKNPQGLGKSNLTDQQWAEQLPRANKEASDSLGQLMAQALGDPGNFNKNLLDDAA